MGRISELAKDYMDFVTDESNQVIIKNLIQAADDNATNDNFHCNEQMYPYAREKVRPSMAPNFRSHGRDTLIWTRPDCKHIWTRPDCKQ